MDPLSQFRQAIATNSAIIPTTSSGDGEGGGDTTPPRAVNLASATHLRFSGPGLAPHSFPLDTPTRFAPSGKPVDLRSIYFAWLRKDVAIPDYVAEAQRLSEQLSAAGVSGAQVQNLVFVQRLDLITWLEGASEESEFIKPLAGAGSASTDAGDDGEGSTESPSVAAASITATAGPPFMSIIGEVGAAGGGSGVRHAATSTSAGGGSAAAGAGGVTGRPAKPVNPRLVHVYKNERRMSDRNIQLRGVKASDFSHARKLAELFLGRGRHSKVIGGVGSALPAIPHHPASISPAASSLPKKPGSGANGTSGASAGGRRPDPIILLSPSASSLLRMNNVKAFLEGGVFTPSEVVSGSASAANILHVSRLLPSIDPARPLRFILVDTPTQFKPDYWQRVVAVFTTGQTWQFREYKWPQAPELFKHVLGVFVGYRGEEVPSIVKNWGRGVMITYLDKWYANQSCANGRWRDREVVEGIWGAIEESMKIRGWGKEGRAGINP